MFIAVYAVEVNCFDCGVDHTRSVPQAPDPVHAAEFAQPTPPPIAVGAAGVVVADGIIEGVCEGDDPGDGVRVGETAQPAAPGVTAKPVIV